jgi:cyclophilin family peptidyl-prolyl cis-trans isomerase
MKRFTPIALLLLAWSAGSATAGDNPQVELRTNRGSIVVELYPEKAPKTVANFLQYARDGFYNGTIFHRVIPGFVIQGGGFDANLRQKDTRAPIENEAANGLRNERGTLSMARTNDPQSATAQFFVNLANNVMLDYRAPTSRGYGYAVFARVIKGMDVVDGIATVATGSNGMMQDVPQTPIVVERACVLGSKPSC